MDFNDSLFSFKYYYGFTSDLLPLISRNTIIIFKINSIAYWYICAISRKYFYFSDCRTFSKFSMVSVWKSYRIIFSGCSNASTYNFVFFYYTTSARFVNSLCLYLSNFTLLSSPQFCGVLFVRSLFTGEFSTVSRLFLDRFGRFSRII